MRVAVFDLDGTLLGSDHQARPRVVEALGRFRSRGGRVILASSRPPKSIDAIAHSLGLDDEPAIALNGAVVVCRGQLSDERPLPRAWASTFIEQTRDLRPFVYGGDGPSPRPEGQRGGWLWGVLEGGPESRAESRAVGFEPMLIEDEAELEPILKVTASGPPDEVARRMALLEEKLPEASLTRPQPPSLELMAAGVNKASALERVLSRIGVSWREVVACGDGENDVEMLRCAGMGVAMANATPGARLAAQKVVGAHDSDTLADLLDDLCSLRGI